MPQPPVLSPLATPKLLSADDLGTLMRCAVGYAMQSDSYLALSLPEVFSDAHLANVSTETLTFIYGDIKQAVTKAENRHQHIGNAETHLAWQNIASRIGHMVTARNQPTWRARPR